MSSYLSECRYLLSPSREMTKELSINSLLMYMGGGFSCEWEWNFLSEVGKLA